MTEGKSSKLTQVQKAQIYCVKHGHANYISMCFGYVHCGRCGEQIGDRLAGVFDTTSSIVLGHKCEKCDAGIKKLSAMDKKIVASYEKNESFTDQEKILKGIVIK